MNAFAVRIAWAVSIVRFACSSSAPAIPQEVRSPKPILERKSGGRFVAASAGTRPAAEVHPDAVAILAQHGIDWSGRYPKAIESVQRDAWDFVITVCDRAKETCPAFPGEPVFAHWGMPDPAEIEEPGERRRAFRETAQHLTRRIELMLAMPFEKLERWAVEQRLRRIGSALPETSDKASPR